MNSILATVAGGVRRSVRRSNVVFVDSRDSRFAHLGLAVAGDRVSIPLAIGRLANRAPIGPISSLSRGFAVFTRRVGRRVRDASRGTNALEGMRRARWRIARSRKRRRNRKAWSLFPVDRIVVSSRDDSRRNDPLARFRTVDARGNTVASNANATSTATATATAFTPTERDRDDVIFDRFSRKRSFPSEDLVSIELIAAPTDTDTDAANARTLPSHDAEDEQRVYTDAFLESCGELASHDRYGDRAVEEQRATTWFSRLRRRCSTVRDWLPTMCSCFEGSTGFARVGNYQRLGVLEFDRPMDDARGNRVGDGVRADVDDEEVDELRFYNDDHSWNDLLVERNLRTIDACQLLKVKRNVSGIDWSIVETWPELGIERTLEDHEDVSAVYRDTKSFASRYRRKFVFRLDVLKYEFFFEPELSRAKRISLALSAGSGVSPVGNDPTYNGERSLQRFSPDETIEFPHAFADDEGTLTDAETALTNYLQRDDGECPQVFSLAWIRIDRLDVWRRTHVLLRDRKLYLARKTSVISLNRLPDNEQQLIPYAHLSDYSIYKIANAKDRLKAPFDWGVCLRPSCNAEADSTVPGESGLRIVIFHSEKSRVCWLTAMRLAKYGKQLRENYRAFKNKQCEQGGGDGRKERYVNYSASNESTRSHVAMDFTGSVGRIVEDPQEAKNIAENEGVNWRRTWRPFLRAPPGCAVVRLHGLDDGIHVLQPWFHRDLKRDVAAAIVRNHGSVDGVFLVRESKSNLGAYVLTYKYSDKVFHAQIQPVFDERCNCWLYTLDKGITKFYDLLQLIEFYQLNAGCLPTRLTRYVQNDVPCAVPRPEDGGASPSSPELAHRLSGVGNNVVSTGAGHRSI